MISYLDQIKPRNVLHAMGIGPSEPGYYFSDNIMPALEIFSAGLVVGAAGVAGPLGGEDGHDDGVEAFAVPPQSVAKYALGDEPGLFVGAAGTGVEGEDLQRDPVQAQRRGSPSSRKCCRGRSGRRDSTSAGGQSCTDRSHRTRGSAPRYRALMVRSRSRCGRRSRS